jgi:hypothetical protein
MTMTAGIDLSRPHLRVWVYAIAVHAALFSIFYGPNGTGVLFIVVGGGVIFELVRMYHDGEALILFVSQLLYGYLFVGFFAESASKLYDAHVSRDSPLRLGDLVMWGIVGLLAGWSVARAKLSIVGTGKWIWVVPVPILAYSFLHDWLWRCECYRDATTVYFYSSADLTRGLITGKAFSLTGYSLGAWIASRMRVRHDPPALF